MTQNGVTIQAHDHRYASRSPSALVQLAAQVTESRLGRDFSSRPLRSNTTRPYKLARERGVEGSVRPERESYRGLPGSETPVACGADSTSRMVIGPTPGAFEFVGGVSTPVMDAVITLDGPASLVSNPAAVFEPAGRAERLDPAMRRISARISVALRHLGCNTRHGRGRVDVVATYGVPRQRRSRTARWEKTSLHGLILRVPRRGKRTELHLLRLKLLGGLEVDRGPGRRASRHRIPAFQFNSGRRLRGETAVACASFPPAALAVG